MNRSDPVLHEVEACWAAVAGNIRRRRRDLPIHVVEQRARSIVGRPLLPGDLPTVEPAAGNSCENRGIEELTGSAIEQIGPGLFQVRHGDPSSANRLPLDDERQSPSLHAKAGDNVSDEKGGVDLDAEMLPDLFSRLSDAGRVHEVSMRPSRTLGLVHEWFLGKRLQATRSADFIVRSSAAARKAQGMFYTPEFVAEYIAEHALNVWSTSGKGAHFHPVRILDPACGCGTFSSLRSMCCENVPMSWKHPTASIWIPPPCSPPAGNVAAIGRGHAQPASWNTDAEKPRTGRGSGPEYSPRQRPGG